VEVTAAGLCGYNAHFRSLSKRDEELANSKPDLFADARYLQAAGSCPRQDRGYTFVSGITEQSFLALTRFVKTATRSSHAIRKNLAATLSPQEKKSCEAFRKEMIRRADDAPVSIQPNWQPKGLRMSFRTQVRRWDILVVNYEQSGEFKIASCSPVWN
jgi:hypothetical protein